MNCIIVYLHIFFLKKKKIENIYFNKLINLFNPIQNIFFIIIFASSKTKKVKKKKEIINTIQLYFISLELNINIQLYICLKILKRIKTIYTFHLKKV